MLAVGISAVTYLVVRIVVALIVYGTVRKVMTEDQLSDPFEVQVARIFGLALGSAAAVYLAHQWCRRLIGDYPQKAVLAAYLFALGWMCLSVWMDEELSGIARAHLMLPALSAMATAVVIHSSRFVLREREGAERV